MQAEKSSVVNLMHWRRKWQPTPVFLPGESQGRRILVGCRLRGRTELDTTEVTYQQQQPQTRRKQSWLSLWFRPAPESNRPSPTSSAVSVCEVSGVPCLCVVGWGLLSCPLPPPSLTSVKKSWKPCEHKKDGRGPGRAGWARSHCSLTLWTWKDKTPLQSGRDGGVGKDTKSPQEKF